MRFDAMMRHDDVSIIFGSTYRNDYFLMTEQQKLKKKYVESKK